MVCVARHIQILAVYCHALFLLPVPAMAQTAPQNIPVLALPDLNPWQDKLFSAKTDYRVVETSHGTALQARSDKAASGLLREIHVDLTKTPYLHWSWRVEQTFRDIDETARNGDDYPARLYVVISGGWQFWRTRALNYVWASQRPQNSHWPNAYTDHAVMIAVRSGEQQAGIWVDEKRNVLEDIRRYLNSDATGIDAVAIMTDTDNTGGSATAYYGDIYFSDQ